jgi:5-methylcytosine-specific restriction protein A
MPTLPKRERISRPFEGINKSNYGLYNSQRWRMTSHAYRAKHPLCEQCLKKGITFQATTTDHIIPINQGGKIWDWNNLQSLCDSCNASKTGKQSHENQ